MPPKDQTTRKARVPSSKQVAKANARGKGQAPIFNRDGITITRDQDLSCDSPQYYPALPRRASGELEFQVATAKYATSQDARGGIPVYEYELVGLRLPGEKPTAKHVIMWDRQKGNVLFTGVWQCLTTQKADLARVLEGVPQTKIRGGCLKIQGTWIPYEHALEICKKCAWPIRHFLVPLFGRSFVEACIPNSQQDSLADLCARAVTPATKASSRAVRREPRAPYPSSSSSADAASARGRSAFRLWSSSSSRPVVASAPTSCGVPDVTFCGPAFSAVASTSGASTFAAYCSAFPYLSAFAPVSSRVASFAPASAGFAASRAVFPGLGGPPSASSVVGASGPVLSVPVASHVGLVPTAFSGVTSSAPAFTDPIASMVYSGVASSAPAFTDSAASMAYSGVTASASVSTDSAASHAVSSGVTAPPFAFSGVAASGGSRLAGPGVVASGGVSFAPGFSGVVSSGPGASVPGASTSDFSGGVASTYAFPGGVVSGPGVSVSDAFPAPTYTDPAGSTSAFFGGEVVSGPGVPLSGCSTAPSFSGTAPAFCGGVPGVSVSGASSAPALAVPGGGPALSDLGPSRSAAFAGAGPAFGGSGSCPPLVRPVPVVLPSPGVPRPVLPTVHVVESVHSNTTEECADIIRGSIGLVLLSRDTGERPFPAGRQLAVPGHVVVGDKSFTVSWD